MPLVESSSLYLQYRELIQKVTVFTTGTRPAYGLIDLKCSKPFTEWVRSQRSDTFTQSKSLSKPPLRWWYNQLLLNQPLFILFMLQTRYKWFIHLFCLGNKHTKNNKYTK